MSLQIPKLDVLCLYDFSGIMGAPWVEDGFRVGALDRRRPPGIRKVENFTSIGADIRRVEFQPRGLGACFAFPPCDDLAVSGARWFAVKGPIVFKKAVELADLGRTQCEKAVLGFLENPVSRLAGVYGKPNHYFHPRDYGDGYKKKTCLWTFGKFKMPVKNPVPITKRDYIHRLGSVERKTLGSLTPQGFAQAVWKANRALI